MQTAVIQLHPQRSSRKAPMELISELQSLGCVLTIHRRRAEPARRRQGRPTTR
jgi:hypothetical protein